MIHARPHVTRTNLVIRADPSRVLLRAFVPGDADRIRSILARVLSIPEDRVPAQLEAISTDFSWRHKDFPRLLAERCDSLREYLPSTPLTEARRKLAGAYFLSEYSVESAALFNPSIVPDPDQSGLPPGAVRFVLSLRATGEGHVSSITFRTGIVHADNRIEVVTPTGLLSEPRQIPNPTFEKALFQRTALEVGLAREFTRRALGRAAGTFTLQELRSAIDAEVDVAEKAGGVLEEDRSAATGLWALARSNFQVSFRPDQHLSERILFPASPSQRNGIEDARFVCFRNDDGGRVYYATFTAFDGAAVMPELVETSDFLHFRFITLNGPAARNKGMALFPRKVNGRYAMLSRQDNENIHIMFSDNVHFWNEQQLLLKPHFPWELIQLGNCGSPIETEAGWLVLSHGVGAMRKYSIGAFLLDRGDPSKVIGRLREPLLEPNQNEREGYVPNVVYTCGALLHGTELIIPYGLSDHSTGFATVNVGDVLGAMETDGI